MHCSDYKSFIPLENVLIQANKQYDQNHKLKKFTSLSKSIIENDFKKMLSNDFLSQKSASKGNQFINNKNKNQQNKAIPMNKVDLVLPDLRIKNYSVVEKFPEKKEEPLINT